MSHGVETFMFEQVAMVAILKLDWVDVSFCLANNDVLSPLPLHAAHAIIRTVLKLLWLAVIWPIVVVNTGTNLQMYMSVSNNSSLVIL